MLQAIYRIPFRIYLIVVMAAALAASLSYLLLSHMVDASYEMRQEALADNMDIAVSVLEDFHARAEAGEIPTAEAREQAFSLIGAMRFGAEGNGYFVIQDEEMQMLMHPILTDLVGQDQSGLTDSHGLRITQVITERALAEGEGAQRYWFAKPGSDVPEEKLGYFRHFEPWGVVLTTGDYVSDIRAGMDNLRAFVSVALAIGVAALIAVSAMLARSVTRPLSRFMESMRAVSEGDYDQDIPVARRRDEIGHLGRDLLSFRDRLRESDGITRQRERESVEQARVVSELRTAMERLSRGDLSHTIETEFPTEYEGLRQDFNETVTTLDELITSVVENARGIHSRAEEISSASVDLSRRTESQAATLEETAAAMDELTASVGSASENAAGVATAVDAARSNAEHSGEVVEQSIRVMDQIKQSSDSILRIISLIDDIAFQTNLLALNAGVEAARAGESGRGFAVVASEVRALAQRSSDAAKEISQLINESSGHVEAGVTQVHRTGEALEDIVKRVTSVAELIRGIADGAKEQSAGISEINVGVTQLDQVTQQNAAMVEQTTAASMALKEDAGILSGLMAHFQLRDLPQNVIEHDAGPTASQATGWESEMEVDPVPLLPAPQPKVATASGGGGSTWQDF
ncbi:methyl-accepting chemotaxis protein [Allosediminivita pacifica]|uniref:Methyl-accepting chemotaxis sensory transducer with Cache sensor n=1 Tax=Allosediminivita pacifica TaxID=1267769 RepID=A0A2T6ABD4_9RHOB|nr:methyl-accepting chemotaxis protein [Allosediminivita pacifica]PTX41133.1 methyl-accepting chemotaxis sensory transducer with Cache sensor [Allosediminivita pacifica]GGB24893.1 methyl-accepting chemotaxis protein [Allosediminivita pacifica]